MTTDPHAGAELTDDALQDEIELVGDLVVAASSSEGPLSEDEIDAALGITRSRPDGTGDARGAAAHASGHGSGHGSERGASHRQHV